MAKKLPLPSRTMRSSEVFQRPGEKYDPTQETAADSYNDMIRARLKKDTASGRAKDAMYGESDAGELEKLANTPERGFGPTLAKRELLKRSDEGEYAAPGYGDQGQFLKKGGKVNLAKYMSFSKTGKPAGMKSVTKMASGGSASSRGDGIAKRGKTKGRMC